MKYSIEGGSLPVVICTINEGETIFTETGSMSWMTPNIKMDTSSNGGIGKMLGRLFTGESIFQNRYTSTRGEGTVAFASCFPGKIKAIEVAPNREIIVQKNAFLAAQSSVELSVYFQKKLGAGIFGGEGFVLQKLSGKGIAFVEIDGHAVEYNLAVGEELIVNTGYLAYMDATCSMDVRSVKGVKNVLLGGEGLFNTVVRGPGNVVLQTMPISKVAEVLQPFFPQEVNVNTNNRDNDRN